MKHFEPRSCVFFLAAIACIAVFSIPGYTAQGNEPLKDVLPVNPRTIPEYDTVAGVVMYWNPGNNNSYDQIVAAVVNGIQSSATVFLQTNSEAHRNNMINTFTHFGVPLDDIVFINVYGDRIWIRDHGPFSIYDNNELAFVGFNDLAANHGDKDLPERLADYWDLNYYDFSHIIFDGGNYLVDSHNRLFATDRLYTNNPSIDPADIDGILEAYMGISEIYTFSALSNDYWGHLDMQIKLLNDTTFIISTVDKWHSDYQILQDNLAILQSLEHPEGKTYNIVQIPKAQNWKTYINSLIVNDVVLVPVYNDPRDAQALAAYEALMPESTVIGIDCNAMIHWEGAIHCITNQLPPFHAPEDDGHYTVSFVVTCSLGEPLYDAVITLGGDQNAPGDYVFDGIAPGAYSYSIEDMCHEILEGSLTVANDNVSLSVSMNGIPGDANGDGHVNVLDVLTIVQYYVEMEPEPFCFANADVNEDGIIDVLDILHITEIYMENGDKTHAGKQKPQIGIRTVPDTTCLPKPR